MSRDLIWLRQEMERTNPDVTKALDARMATAAAWTRGKPPALTVRCDCGAKLLMASRTPAGIAFLTFFVRDSDIDGYVEVNSRRLPAAAVPDDYWASWTKPGHLDLARALQASPFHREQLVLAGDVLPWPASVPQPKTILARCPGGEHHLAVADVLTWLDEAKARRLPTRGVPHRAQGTR